MSNPNQPVASDAIERLSKARIINTDITLREMLDVASSVSSTSADPIDWWCGTIHNPWAVFRPRFEIDKQLGELNKSITELKDIAGELRGNPQR